MIAANRTVALGGTREALVRGRVGDGYANIAALHIVSLVQTFYKVCPYLAVIEVFAQSFSPSADSTVWAVVDLLFAVVVPELADITIVTCSFGFTVLADIGCWLRRAACHTQHVLCHLPVEVMVFDCIMTVSARVPSATFKALHLDVALVMLATENQFSFGAVLVVVFAMFCTGMVGMGSVRRVRVAFSKIVRYLRSDIRGRRVRR
jgi:hypothetical protein